MDSFGTERTAAVVLAGCAPAPGREAEIHSLEIIKRQTDKLSIEEYDDAAP